MVLGTESALRGSDDEHLLQRLPATNLLGGLAEKPDNDDDNDGRCCRICLEADHPEDLIAPCSCKGGSKWVHRGCLDLWRTVERDRAFATCTECQFPYRYEKQLKHGSDRRILFYLLVSRDLCLVTAAVQFIIAIFGLAVYGVLRGDEDWNFVCEHTSSLANDTSATPDNFCCRHEVGTYYILGLFVLLICMGIFGSIFLCCNRCKIPSLNAHVAGNTPPAASTMRGMAYVSEGQQQHSQFYRAQRRRRQPVRDVDECCCCCYSPYGGYYPYYYPYASYGGPVGGQNDSDCCCGAHHHIISGSGGGVGSGSGNSNDCGGNSGAGHELLIVLLVVAIILVIIGFAVGVFVVVILVQRIAQRHIFLLQKRRLVDEYRIADLSTDFVSYHFQGDRYYDPELGRQMERNTSNEEVDKQGGLTNTAQQEMLSTENESHLRKLGLFGQNP